MKFSLRYLAICAFCGAIAIQAQEVTSLQIATGGKAVTEGKLAVGGSRTLTVLVEPAEAASLPVTWSVDKPELLSFDATTAGKIRGMKGGTAVVTAEVGGVEAHYTVAVTQKDAVVGNYYFDNDSWESGGIVAGKQCIGVIFYVNPDDKQSGKIVSLDEAVTMKWSLAEVDQPGADSDIDGMSNLRAIAAAADWKSKFDAEAWCVDKEEGNVQWYLPAIDELRQLYAATCGLTWVESGANEANKEVNNWTEMGVAMESDLNAYSTERAAFNKKFSNIGKTVLNEDGTIRYWSSTEYESDFAKLLSFEGGFSLAQPRQYFHVANVRAIAQFPPTSEDLGSINTVDADSRAGKLLVYPNPATTVATVEAPAAIAAVDVYTLLGVKSVVEVEAEGTTAAINVQSLTPGIYIVAVTATNGTRYTSRLIKR